jgi:hypothetical protein
VTAIALWACPHWWVSPAPSVRRTLAIVLPYLAVDTAFLVWGRHLVGAIEMPVPPNIVENPLAHVRPLVRIATAVVIIGQYLLLLTAPITLSSDYSFEQVPLVASSLDPRLLATVGALIGLVAILRRTPVRGTFPRADSEEALPPFRTSPRKQVARVKPALEWGTPNRPALGCRLHASSPTSSYGHRRGRRPRALSCPDTPGSLDGRFRPPRASDPSTIRGINPISWGGIQTGHMPRSNE